MLLFDKKNWQPHQPWCIACVLISIGAFGWLWWASRDLPYWASGSSLPGFVCGVAGGLIILFECFLWFRKRYLRVWRIGTAQTWLRIHIWLGLLCLPLLILHSGFRWGGWLSTVLMTLLIIVVASGVLGLVLQNILPRRMLHEIPAETIYSQIDTLADQLVIEADRLVSATCSTKPLVKAAQADGDIGGVVVVGALRRAGPVEGKVLGTRAPAGPVENADALAAFFENQVVTFLRGGEAANPRLGNASQAAVLFQNLKTEVPIDAHDVVATLENFCEQRRQWDSQARMHFWLHCWLWVHFPFSVALFVLMCMHVFVALKYW